MARNAGLRLLISMALGAISAVAASLVAADYATQSELYAPAADWLPADGLLHSVHAYELESGGRAQLQAAYEYRVDDQTYTGSSITPSASVYTSIDEAEAAAVELLSAQAFDRSEELNSEGLKAVSVSYGERPAKPITVYYNPRSPAEAVLKAQPTTAPLLMFITGGIALGCIIWMIYEQVNFFRRQMRPPEGE